MEKERKSWSKSVEKDGITTSINVREAENGFVINVERYGYLCCKEDDESLEELESSDEEVMDKREWISESKQYISKVNPLGDESTSIKDQIASAIKSIKL